MFTFPVKKSKSVFTYVNPLILDITCAASFPSPFRITLNGSFLTLFADFAIPIAPSAAAKLSCPAKNAKHFVSSDNSIDAKFPCPNPTFLSSATEPGIQNACNPSPIAFAASDALLHPFLIAIAAPNVYAQAAFSKHIG